MKRNAPAARVARALVGIGTAALATTATPSVRADDPPDARSAQRRCPTQPPRPGVSCTAVGARCAFPAPVGCTRTCRCAPSAADVTPTIYAWQCSTQCGPNFRVGPLEPPEVAARDA